MILNMILHGIRGHTAILSVCYFVGWFVGLSVRLHITELGREDGTWAQKEPIQLTMDPEKRGGGRTLDFFFSFFIPTFYKM